MLGNINDTQNQNNNSLAGDENSSNNNKITKEEFLNENEKEKTFEFGMTIEALNEIGEFLNENNANNTMQSNKNNFIFQL